MTLRQFSDLGKSAAPSEGLGYGALRNSRGEYDKEAFREDSRSPLLKAMPVDVVKDGDCAEEDYDSEAGGGGGCDDGNCSSDRGSEEGEFLHNSTTSGGRDRSAREQREEGGGGQGRGVLRSRSSRQQKQPPPPSQQHRLHPAGAGGESSSRGSSPASVEERHNSSSLQGRHWSRGGAHYRHSRADTNSWRERQREREREPPRSRSRSLPPRRRSRSGGGELARETRGRSPLSRDGSHHRYAQSALSDEVSCSSDDGAVLRKDIPPPPPLRPSSPRGERHSVPSETTETRLLAAAAAAGLTVVDGPTMPTGGGPPPDVETRRVRLTPACGSGAAGNNGPPSNGSVLRAAGAGDDGQPSDAHPSPAAPPPIGSHPLAAASPEEPKNGDEDDQTPDCPESSPSIHELSSEPTKSPEEGADPSALLSCLPRGADKIFQEPAASQQPTVVGKVLPAADAPPDASGSLEPSAQESAASKAVPSRPAKKPRSSTQDDAQLMRGWQSLLARTRKHPEYVTEYTSRFASEGAAWLRCDPATQGRLAVGLDCEMVYMKGDNNALARVSIVGFGGVLLDAHVLRRPEDVLDYRSHISGVKSEHLLEENGAMPFEKVQEQVLARLAPTTILVGHSLQSDLRALGIRHDRIVDTALLFLVEGMAGRRRRHALTSLVSLMKPHVTTLRNHASLRNAAHDPRQDAEWSLQLALYEASIHPRSTKPLPLEAFPLKIFLAEVPRGTERTDLQALFPGGVMGEIDYQLQAEDSGEWFGRTTVAYSTRAGRDSAFEALARFVSVRVGPLSDWVDRRDSAKMRTELLAHFAHYGRVRGCRLFHPRLGGSGGRSGALGATQGLPFALLLCHPATAHTLLTATGGFQSFATHISQFEVHLAEEDSGGKRRLMVPLGKGSHIVAQVKG